jgi:hypothetical protein
VPVVRLACSQGQSTDLRGGNATNIATCYVTRDVCTDVVIRSTAVQPLSNEESPDLNPYNVALIRSHATTQKTTIPCFTERFLLAVWQSGTLLDTSAPKLPDQLMNYDETCVALLTHYGSATPPA